MGLKTRAGGPWWASLPFRVVLAAAALGLFSAPISVQATAFNDCSQTVGLTAAPVVFPASGKTGPPAPTAYLEICVANTAAAALGINYVGGTAAFNTPGTVRLLGSSVLNCMRWENGQIPQTISLIGSTSSITTACAYR